MKRLIIVLIGVCLISLSGCGIYNLSFFTIPDDTKFLETIEKLSTPLEISDFMMKNFTYELHGFYAPDPYTLWKTGRGDCNDMSTWAQWVGNYHGYEPWQIQIFYLVDPLWRHWVAVFNEDGRYNFTDNQLYFSINATSFREIVEYDSEYLTFKTWIKYIVFDYWNNIVKIGYNN